MRPRLRPALDMVRTAVVRVAGEDVPAAGPVGVEQTLARGLPVVRWRRHAEAGSTRTTGRCPSPTSGTRACPRSTRAGCPPGWRRSATTSRWSIRSADASRAAANRPVSERFHRGRRGAARRAQARRSGGTGRPSHRRPRRPSALVRGGSDARITTSSSSSASSAVRLIVTTVRPATTAEAPTRTRRGSRPGTSSATRPRTAAFSTSGASPSVSTVNGSASRTSTGQTRAFSTPSRAAASSAGTKPSMLKPGSAQASSSRVAAVTTQTTRARHTGRRPGARLAHDATRAGTVTGTFGVAMTTRQSGASMAARRAKSSAGVT